ncbi:MAG: response regulator [Lachnospiraceae bacterium]|nr:response regulator [Lachnospiraceae bacterium]
MNEIMLEVAAVWIALFCFVDCLKNRRHLYLPFPKTWEKKLQSQHFVYLMLLLTLLLSAIPSVIEVILENYVTHRSALALTIVNEAYFIFHTVLSVLFTLYIVDMTNAANDRSRDFFLLFLLPFFVGELLVIFNPITHLIYYVDEAAVYHRGPYLWTLYLIAAIYVVVGVIFFFRYIGRLSKMDRVSILILISIAIFGICIQAAFAIPVELFFEAIGFLGFLMLLEDKGARHRGGRSSRISKGFIVVVSLIFLTVIIININLIYHVGSDQTGTIGRIRIDSIKGELQETISSAEGNLLRFAMGTEQLLNESASQEQLEEYIREQKVYYNDVSGGNCYNVYAASTDWTIIPDFDMPDTYHAVERSWYLGASQNVGTVYITEPYIDAATGDLCFTLAYLLSDGKTVTAMDYTLTKVQEIVNRMGTEKDQMAMVVTDDGMLVGCSDTTLLGSKLQQAMPEYKDVFDWVKASNEHLGFDTRIDGKNKIVFSSETSNGWQLILVEDSDNLYSEIYRQMVMLGTVDVLMVAVIIVFYLVSVNNQEKSETTLASTESFLSRLAEDLKTPLHNILRVSDLSLKLEETDTRAAMRDITESGMRLQEKVNNLVSYSNILREGIQEESVSKEKTRRSGSVSSRYIRNGIIGILVGALCVGLVICLGTTTNWGKVRIGREADRYNNELTQWMLKQQSILQMFTDVIVADPSVLDDYDSAVKWLDDIGQNYSEMSFCYMANPYNKEHAIIMNNGWVPEPDYKVEERQWYIDTVNSGDGYNISAPYYDAQTGLYCITFSQTVYSKDGNFLGVFAIDCFIDKLIDVLADSYSEEGYAFLVDPDGVIINHPDKAYEMTSDSSVNIEDTQYADAYHHDSVVGMRDYNGKYVACYAQKSKDSGFTVVVVQSWWSIYGSVFWMVLIFLLLIIASIIAVAVMINRFIGWQEEANEKLVAAANEAVEAGKAKSQFLAQMSHEIRTPINAVLGMNEMILRESEDPSIREYAGNIHSAGRNLLGLINSILDFSKIEEGRMEIIPVRYETAVMLDNVIHSILQRAEDKGLLFEAHIDRELPGTLFGDDMRLSQIIVNLLTNAVKYTREGRVDLFVKGVKKEGDRIRLQISVKDTGIGIKEEDLDKLFDSFTRLDETRNRNIEGTGLGMAIVTRLLDMMGSKLSVESEYGKGSEFSFEVEQDILDETPIGDFEQRAKELAEKKDEDSYLYAPKARLLVVDDNELNLKVIKNLLKRGGMDPTLASSGAQALEYLQKETFDVVLLDHMMPHMDGIETLQKARQESLIPDGCSVIALTANAVVGARESYLEAGFDDYLSKPVEVKALESALSRYLPEDLWEMRKTEDEKSKQEATKEVQSSENEEVLEFAPGGEDVLEFAPSGEDAADGSQNDDGAFFDRLKEGGISVEEGLGYCAGDKMFYREVLGDYADAMEERLGELDEALTAGDMETYAIKVHALKSVARSVGDTGVFEQARDLEAASKEGQEEVVRKGHGPLSESYRASEKLIHEPV